MAAIVQLANPLDQRNSVTMWHPQIHYDEIQIVEVGADVRQQLCHGLDDHRTMASGIKSGLEAIAHERCVRSNEHGLACRG